MDYKNLTPGFRSLSANELQEQSAKGIPVIDIRREDEWEIYGLIENSLTLTFFDGYGNFDLESWMKEFQKIVTSTDQPFILVCAHANRTKAVGEMLGLKFGYKYVWELDGGINYGWLDLGFTTVEYPLK